MKANSTLKTLSDLYLQKRGLSVRIVKQVINYINSSIGSSAKNVIDLGCGAGRILVPLAISMPQTRFVGVDLSSDMFMDLSKNISLNSVVNIHPVLANLNDTNWTHEIPPAQYDAAILFQSIHFIHNLQSFFGSLAATLVPNNQIIIATTTHEQFHKLPYCLHFPKVLDLELSRTPSVKQIIQVLSSFKYHLVSEKSFMVTKEFSTNDSLRSWLGQKPFSVLSLISPDDFQHGVETFVGNHRRKTIVDMFSIFVFQNSG